MKILNYLITTLFILVICNISIAQNALENRVTAMSRSYNNKIVLRLFNSSPASLIVGNKKGYIIQKADFKSGELSNLSFINIQNSFSYRMNEDSANVYIERNKITDSFEREMAGLAYFLTEDKGQKTNDDILTEGTSSLKEHIQDEAMKFFMINIACNRSKLAAKVMGLWVEDENVIVGKTYVYRVKINDDNNDWFYIKVNCENFNPKYLLKNDSITLNEGDSKIDFKFPEGDDFYAFNVNRSNFNHNNYVRLNKEPILKITPNEAIAKTDYVYGDSTLINYKIYYYQIWVNTPFGDELIYAEFSAMPRDKTAPDAPYIKSALHIKPNQVEIKWEMKDKNSNDLKGFNISLGNDNAGPFKKLNKNLLPTNKLTYIDESFSLDTTNFYVVEAIDTAGNISRSFPAYVTLIDSIPPATPIIASAIIDSLGRVIIKMIPNKEKDFLGYEVQKANQRDHEFSTISQTFLDSINGNTTFVIYDTTTLNTLTKHIYYKVIAYDTHFNQSPASAIIELKRRDTIPPVPPILTNFKLTDTTVVLTFANSSSDDLEANYLLRKEANTSKFDTIFINKNAEISQYVDTKIIGGKTYEYTMMAIDDSGLKSKFSRSLIIKTILNDNLPTPKLTGRLDVKSNEVTLNVETDSKLKGEKVYVEISKRKNNKAVWNVWKTIELDKANNFIDQNYAKGQIYIVRLLDAESKSSNYSKPLTL
jgi:uncharacterized protein